MLGKCWLIAAVVAVSWAPVGFAATQSEQQAVHHYLLDRGEFRDQEGCIAANHSGPPATTPPAEGADCSPSTLVVRIKAASCRPPDCRHVMYHLPEVIAAPLGACH